MAYEARIYNAFNPSVIYTTKNPCYEMLKNTKLPISQIIQNFEFIETQNNTTDELDSLVQFNPKTGFLVEISIPIGNDMTLSACITITGPYDRRTDPNGPIAIASIEEDDASILFTDREVSDILLKLGIGLTPDDFFVLIDNEYYLDLLEKESVLPYSAKFAWGNAFSSSVYANMSPQFVEKMEIAPWYIQSITEATKTPLRSGITTKDKSTNVRYYTFVTSPSISQEDIVIENNIANVLGDVIIRSRFYKIV